MRKVVAIGVLAVLAAGLAGCDAGRSEDGGPRVSKNYAVGGFDSIEAAGPYDVEVRTGANPSVSATGAQKMIDHLVVEVQGNRLLIHAQQMNGSFHVNWGSHGGVRVEVTVPQLRAASLAGSGDLRINQVKGDSFQGQLAGSGDLSLDNVDVQALTLSIAGSGDLKAGNGRAQSLKLNAAGSGDVDAKSLQIEQADLSIAGSGDVAAHVTGAAQISLLGSGDVELTGGAKCQVTKMGSGDVHCS